MKRARNCVPCDQVALQALLILIVGSIMLQNSCVQFVQSDLTLAGFSIEVGNLSSASAKANAVAKLSNGPNQQSWWKLADAPWHDSAIQRYFKQGPLLAEEMERLAEMSGKDDPWKASSSPNISAADSAQTDLMGVLQNLSTARYQMKKTIKGTGKIEASMWTLVFQCWNKDITCDQGHLMPIVAIQKDNQTGEAQYIEYSYATLWLNVSSTTVLVNAIPSFIDALREHHSKEYPVNTNDPELSIHATVYDYNLPRCSYPAFVNSRSLLDASYGLVPGLACIRFMSTNINETELPPLNILVSHTRLSAYNSTFTVEPGPKPSDVNPLEDFLSHSLQVNGSDKWEPRPFEECSAAMLMQSFQDVPKSRIMLCDPNSKICILNSPSSDGSYGSCKGVQHLRFLHLVASRSESCMPMIGGAMFPSVSVISCRMSAPTELEVCNAAVYVDRFLSWTLLSPESRWTSTEGRITSEFRQAPHMTNFSVSHTCFTSISLQPLTSTSQASFHEALHIRARSYLNSFITAHNVAFTTTKGPATDLANFLALTISTALSVVLAISGPFASFRLSIISRIWSHHLYLQRWLMGKILLTIGIQMLCDVLLTVCSFLPVLYLAWSEKKRESSFDTWDLGSADQNIYSSSENGVRLRVVYVLSATSKYSSHFIIASTSIICGTCIFVAVNTARRCNKVLDGYRLLERQEGVILHNIENRWRLYVRALRAINMNEAEYVTIRRQAVELAKLAVARRA